MRCNYFRFIVINFQGSKRFGEFIFRTKISGAKFIKSLKQKSAFNKKKCLKHKIFLSQSFSRENLSDVNKRLTGDLLWLYFTYIM